MYSKNEIESQSKPVSARPQVTSYDSSHEHSIEHWIEVRLMVEEYEEERVSIADQKASAPKFSRSAL